jgi:hypothetical protein
MKHNLTSYPSAINNNQLILGICLARLKQLNRKDREDRKEQSLSGLCGLRGLKSSVMTFFHTRFADG